MATTPAKKRSRVDLVGWMMLISVWLLTTACPSQPAGTCKEDKDCGSSSQACLAGLCVCKAPLATCGQECVDTQRNRVHCGACGKVCKDGESCLSGVCSKGCPTGESECKGACVVLASDPSNCGACEKACKAGEECKEGRCLQGCPAGQESCGGACVDIQAHGSHCGGCGRACPAGQVCAEGSCLASCPAATATVCLGGCVDTERDASHCGSCGAACGDGKRCLQGRCTCPASATICNGRCADLQSDRQDCGSCGVACASGQLCASGSCVASCPAATPTACFGGCIDTQTHVLHCGKCGKTCGVDERCEGGLCGCGAGRLRCSEECVDPKTDLRHCGGCDRLCPRGQRCDGGLCVDSCAAEEARCGEFCVDLKRNALHCSACDQSCTPSEYCNDGTCQPTHCPKGQSRCQGSCVSLQTDPKNCGQCGQACPLKNVCLHGSCYLPPVVEVIGGQPPWRDGSVETARFFQPRGMALDKAGSLYLADQENHRIRKIDPRGNVTTIAGSGLEGFADGPASQAQFDRPESVAFDSAGNLYISDTGNNRIRKLDKTGKVTTFAGGKRGFADGPANQAQFDSPYGLAFDATGNLYVADRDNHRIRQIDPQGNVTTFAGSGSSGYVDGPAAQARFRSPYGLAFSGGILYVADTGNHRIRTIDGQGQVLAFAGSGTAGFEDGDRGLAKFSSPYGVAVDANGMVYVADGGNHRIRKIDPAGGVTTFSGTGAIGYANGDGANSQWAEPYGILFDGVRELFVAETKNHTIRKLTLTGVSRAFAGSPLSGSSEGDFFSARLNSPSGVVVAPSGVVYFTDEDNSQIRQIDPQGNITTIAGSPEQRAGFANGSGKDALFDSPYGLALDDGGNLYVADRDNHQIRKIDPQGNVTTFAGSDAALPVSGLADGLGKQARFRSPLGIFFEPTKKLLYVADTGNHAIRTIDLQGQVTTIAGTSRGYLDGPVAVAKFDDPTGLVVDAAGNVYVVDRGNERIRKIDPQGVVSAFAGTDRNGFTNGPHLQAQFDNPFGIAISKDGFLYVTDENNDRIRKIPLDPKGVVETLAGTGEAGFADGPALQASFRELAGITVDARGWIFFAERGNHLIRVLR